MKDEQELDRLDGFVASAMLDDPIQAQAWARQATSELEGLIDEHRRLLARGGGSFGQELREALERAIVKKTEAAGVVLTDQTEVASLSVHLLAIGVVVDVRLKLGRVP